MQWGPKETKRSTGRPQTRWRDDIQKIAEKKVDADSTKSTNMEKNGRGLYSIVDEISKAEEEQEKKNKIMITSHLRVLVIFMLANISILV